MMIEVFPELKQAKNQSRDFYMMFKRCYDLIGESHNSHLVPNNNTISEVVRFLSGIGDVDKAATFIKATAEVFPRQKTNLSKDMN